ncbi:LuxR family transcriptional regulator [Parachitinimonas caeni]|uniref:LuxR family transcriptional regulator n=1 Tax=Parachitinimonas caeni TaxID=3031301 RepID=A0ABT7DZY7_9NEIS|nr:LuxR family transcriptional regulator [Parachitinimonas caeni]MDK2125394.1 LuxR family transcriptional regulator [Parachitinimonas caeni]
MRKSKLLGYDELQALLSVDSPERLQQEVGRQAARIGFEKFLYGMRSVQGNEAKDFVFSSYPDTWRKHYDSQLYANIDPTVLHCFGSATPIIWNPDIYTSRSQKALAEEASSHGIKFGSSFPIRDRNGDLGLFSLALSTGNASARKHVGETLGAGQLLACFAHEALVNIRLQRLASQPKNESPLTQRELECLKWAAEGKTAWETAQILNLSEHTVIYHIRTAAERLEVRGSRKAVIKAISLGLIRG